MKLYIAGPWVRRPDVIEAAKRFEEAGHVITSRWFTHEGDANDPTGASKPDEEIIQQAIEDIEDVLRAECIVVLNLQKSEGKAVETGLAIAFGKGIISVGPRTNIFQLLGEIVPDVDAALALLSEAEKEG